MIPQQSHHNTGVMTLAYQMLDLCRISLCDVALSRNGPGPAPNMTLLKGCWENHHPAGLLQSLLYVEACIAVSHRYRLTILYSLLT